MSQIPVSQVKLTTGQIVLKDQLPTFVIGRNVVATILAQPKDGMVLVSMFGKKLMVETTMDLQKGQVLNLQVQATSPKVVLKAVEPMMTNKLVMPPNVSKFIEQFTGKAGDIPLKNFSILSQLKEYLETNSTDKINPQFVKSLVDEAVKYPEAMVLLLIPVVQDESQGRASVAIQEESDHSYALHFDMETDHLGYVGCTARVGDGIDVEIRTSSESLAEFMRPYLHELLQGLEGISKVKRLEIVVKQNHQARVNMVV